MKHRLAFILLAVTIVMTGILYAQKFDGLVLTPPMGWNSWNKFGYNGDEQMNRGIADAMAGGGMRRADPSSSASASGAERIRGNGQRRTHAYFI